MNKLLAWLDDRTGYKGILHEALYERIPGGSRWRYVWGSTLVFTFTVQVVTGIFLWTAYSPSAQTAWESVFYINYVMPWGWLVRGLHHFAAQAMVVLLALHLIQVIWDGAYKAPREVNFWLGLVLMQIVLGLSLTGYLLPWDQKGYYATQVATEISGATPVVGLQVQKLIQGGSQYGHHTLTRFFALHAGILPGLLIAFLGLHLYVFRRHGITVPDPDRAPTTTFWPDQVLKDGVACLGVLAVVLLLTVFKGAELSAPANPAEPYSAARPEWYFLFLFRFLKFEWVEHIGLAFGAIYVPGALMTLLALMPIIAYWKGGHRFNVAFMLLMMIAIGGLTGVAMYEDAKKEEHQRAVQQAHEEGLRTIELGKAFGFGRDGAIGALANDPLTQGPKIFAQNCSGCHRYNGHDGTGQKVVESVDGKEVESKPTAADLGTFGTKEWFRSVLLNYEELFGPVANSQWYQEEVGDGAFAPFSDQMAPWSRDNREVLQDPKNAKQLDGLLEYLVSLSGRDGLDLNPELVELGKTLVEDEEGTLAEGAMQACIECHSGIDDPFDPSVETYGYPTLAEYGSQTWLKDFISNPGSPAHYDEYNHMPEFKERLSERDLDLLVRWMTGDYYVPDEE